MRLSAAMTLGAGGKTKTTGVDRPFLLGTCLKFQKLVEEKKIMLPHATKVTLERTCDPVSRTNSINFGDIVEGINISTEFKVTNTGQHPLYFKSAETTCRKCVKIHLPKAPIAPGETVEIMVTFKMP